MSKFKCNRGDEVKYGTLQQHVYHVYEVTDNYITIHIRTGLITAILMEHMESEYNAVYVGPLLKWQSGAHITFKMLPDVESKHA